MVSDIALATDFAIIIVAAAVVGFLAHRSGQPTIVAYIITGLLLGPAAFGIVEVGELTETMAELGLAFLLFLLGIKMRLEDIRHVLDPIVRISIPQMFLVALAGVSVSLAVGFDLWQSVLIGLAVMYSSTAVVIKMLTDMDDATSLHGKIDVGVLLVQDIVVVVLLAVLAAGQPDTAAEVATTLVTILVLFALLGFAAIFASRYLLPGVFRRIADNKDVFFLIAVAWAFLFVFVSEEIELFTALFGIEDIVLSIEMGAFLAGLSIAQLPYSQELQDRVNPLTDLFILVFFVSIGLQLDRDALLALAPEALVAAAVLMPAKFVIFFALIRWQGFDLETTFLGSVNMMQVSEFGLIVGAVAVTGGFIEEELLGFLTVLALTTMALSVYFIQYNRYLYARAEPYLVRFEQDDDGRDRGKKAYTGHAVVIGYDEMTRHALPLLREHYEDVVVIDRQISHIEALEETDYDAIYGDFRHGKIRKVSGLKKADFVLSSSVEPDVNKALLREVGEDATVFVEARLTADARDLYDHGAHYVILGTQLAAERLSEFIEAYITDTETFAREMKREIERLHGTQTRSEPERLSEGDADD